MNTQPIYIRAWIFRGDDSRDVNVIWKGWQDNVIYPQLSVGKNRKTASFFQIHTAQVSVKIPFPVGLRNNTGHDKTPARLRTGVYFKVCCFSFRSIALPVVIAYL